MSNVIVKVSKGQHEKIRKEAKRREQTVSDYVREKLGVQGDSAVTRGETSATAPATKRRA